MATLPTGTNRAGEPVCWEPLDAEWSNILKGLLISRTLCLST
jgi:hypothetical protein